MMAFVMDDGRSKNWRCVQRRVTRYVVPGSTCRGKLMRRAPTQWTGRRQTRDLAQLAAGAGPRIGRVRPIAGTLGSGGTAAPVAGPTGAGAGWRVGGVL
jgi:hypothetical protein